MVCLDPQRAQLNCWWTVTPGAMRAPASRTTSSKGCNSIADTYRSPGFPPVASPRPYPPAGLHVLPLEDPAALERLALLVSTRLHHRIDAPSSLATPR